MVLCCCGLACGSCPTHEGWYSADDGAHPGVEDRDSLHGGVYARVKEDVERGESSDGGVCAQVKEAEAGAAGCKGEEGGSGWRDQFTHERSVARSAHESVVLGFEKHVECIGGGGGEECAGCQVC